MNASDATVPTSTEPGRDGAVGRALASRHQRVTVASMLRKGVENTGSPVQFAVRVIRELPVAGRLYPAEVFRHAGLLIRANSAVIFFMMFMLGAVFSLASHFLFSSIGIESYVAAAHTIGGMRGITEVVFGWTVAAKIGCGIVAEIGSMRISDEIDAMEVMGIRSIPYLVGTRILAALIVTPFLWASSLSLNFLSADLFNVKLLATTSQGAFAYFLYLFQNGQDFLISVIWATVLMLMIIIVASFYGYTARGGPVGVGRNTAQSMLVNLVLISMTALMLVQLFYGNAPNAPIGN